MSNGRGAAGAIRVVRHHALAASPWRNGRGLTRELLRGPDIDGAPAWRIRIAEIVQDGRFSTFPATDRLIAVAQGTGFELIFADVLAPARAMLRPDSPAFPFSGERPCSCRLLAGPVRALNVMTKCHIARASVEIIHVTEAIRPEAWRARAGAERTECKLIVVALDDGLGYRAAGVAGALASGDALCADGPDAAQLVLAPVVGVPRVACILIERSS